MARLSDLIEEFIKGMINDTEGEIEIQRNELASQFNCVPSQINYVISTRFNSERGYFVESRRGGGGYIRIRSLSNAKPTDYLMHVILSMGEVVSQHSANLYIDNFIDYEIISPRDGLLIKAAVNDKSLKNVEVINRDKVRADLIKNMLVRLVVR
ncbi:MAG: CtsR family transcriptional regulator [Clostridia bacterium]